MKSLKNGFRNSLYTENFDEKIRLKSLEQKTRTALISSRGRIFFLGLVFLLGFIFIGIRAIEIALGPVSKHEYKNIEASTKSRLDIVDRKGELFATTIKTYSLYANPRKIWDVEETSQAVLSVLPNLDDKKLKSKLSSKRGFVWIDRNLTPRQKHAIFSLGMPGLSFKAEPKRIYPRGRLASHILGWTDIDLKGIAGIERFLDQKLTVLNSDSRAKPLALSIDMSVQFSLDQTLREGIKKYQAKSASGLVMNVNTGEVLGLVALPDFDPNAPLAVTDYERLNRASFALYEMGSTFKIYTIALALETGAAKATDLFDVSRPMRVSGHEIRDLHPSAYPMTLEEIFVHSSNKGTVQLALKTGIRAQKDFLQRLNLLKKPSIELYENATPLFSKNWGFLESATISYGHGISVSLLSHAAAIAACVNGGEYIKPTILKREAGSMYSKRRVISSATSHTLVEIMRKTVEEGTGRKAEIEGYNIAGKTGSAEKPGIDGYQKKKLISSFIAVFPSQNPKYLVAVLYDEPQPGSETHGQITAGWNAAPTVKNIIKRIAPVLGVKRNIIHQHNIIQAGLN